MVVLALTLALWVLQFSIGNVQLYASRSARSFGLAIFVIEMMLLSPHNLTNLKNFFMKFIKILVLALQLLFFYFNCCKLTEDVNTTKGNNSFQNNGITKFPQYSTDTASPGM